MADEKVSANSNVTVWLVPANGIADYKSPTKAELDAGMDVTAAIAWDGTTFPSGTESDDQDDRSLLDKGNATSRGAQQYEATLNFFYPRDLTDTSDILGQTYDFLRQPRVPVFIVTRVLQTVTGESSPAEAGQWISVFRFLTDSWTDDIEGDDSNKYAIGVLTQGEVAVYTQVKNTTPPTVLPATLAVTVGESDTVRATLGGKRATQVVRWASSDATVAKVSQNGVVTGVGSGTADITASHPSATAASTAVTVTVS